MNMKRLLIFILSAVFLLGSGDIYAMPVYAEGEEGETEETEEVEETEEINYDDSIRILFTENLQDTITPHRKLVKSMVEKEDGTTEEVTNVESFGGYAYLKRAIDSYRTEDSILLDAGDYSTGSIYDTLFVKSAPDLSFLSMMGYDATMFGEREFSNGLGALTQMLNAAYGSPDIIASNLIFADDAETALFKEAYEARGGREYKTFEKGGHLIGVFSVFDPACVTVFSLLGGVSLEEPEVCAQRMVEALKAEGCDYIICLYHSQGAPEKNGSHDRHLAASVEGINLLISGHTVAPTEEPVVVNDTTIVSCGQYGDYLGVVDINKDTLEIMRTVMQPVSPATYEADGTAQDWINSYHQEVQEYTLNRYGYNFDRTFAVTEFNLTDIDRNSDILSNNSVADLITDAYAAYYEPSERDETPVIGMVSRRDVTGSLFSGSIRAEEIFNIIGRGIGEDGTPSSPLARVYMYGSDLFDLCELDCTVFRDEPENQLYFANMRYEYTDDRMPYDRVVEVYVDAAEGYYVPVTGNKLYPVIMEYQLLRRLPGLFEKSGGSLECHVRDSFGRDIKNIDNMILRSSNGQEIKPATAVVTYITRMSHNGSGTPTLKRQYAAARKTKKEIKSVDLISFLKHPSKVALKKYLSIAGWIIGGLLALKLIIFLLNRDWKTKSR